MATIMMQRNLIVTLKKETASNVRILSKFQCMSAELSQLMFKENALDRPTQNLFNHLAYYLILSIDPNVKASLTWPLYDTKGERAFRSELARFISDYSSKGLLAPVLASYLVNPGCYKVTLLMFQLSLLAINRMLVLKMENENKRKLYTEITEKYKSHHNEGYEECIENETHMTLGKISNYLSKRKIMENIAEMLKKKITENITILSTTNAQNYINNLVDGFIKIHDIDEETKLKLHEIKNVKEHSLIFEVWLTHVDKTFDTIEHTWNFKTSSLVKSSATLYQSTQALIAKTTGACERSTYTVEYNHRNDAICTEDLQNQVGSEQKHILKNLQKDGKLNFPYLVRAFVISISFVLKHCEMGDEIYNFNEYLESGQINYSEIVSAMRILLDRLLNAQAKLQPTTIPNDCFLPVKQLYEIPLLPSLANLKASRDCNQILFETFTPLNMTKYQFNLRRKANQTLFAKPQPMSFIAPFHPAPKVDLSRSVISCRISAYDRQTNQESHELSIIPHVNRANETIAGCSSGFTKQQLIRLFSTKKTSSSKKLKYNTERPNIHIKKGGLFNESITSNDSILIRSYSSPNLSENNEKKCLSKRRCRRLSVMQEDSPMSILEMSGITALDKDVSNSTPLSFAESSRKIMDTSSMPVISISSNTENKINNILNMEFDCDKNMGINCTVSPILDQQRETINTVVNSEDHIETPKTNPKVIRRTSPLEKIINRFKKVRAFPEKINEKSVEFKTIFEEKENIKTVNSELLPANRILLPDLISPSCNSIPIQLNVNTDYLEEICNEIDEVESRKPRQSLGTALGVDKNFLDQFELID